jgi:hypothetical protein
VNSPNRQQRQQQQQPKKRNENMPDNNTTEISQPTVTTFKGHNLLVLNPDADKFRQVSFGLRKAKLILDNMDALQTFVEEQEAA